MKIVMVSLGRHPRDAVLIYPQFHSEWDLIFRLLVWEDSTVPEDVARTLSGQPCNSLTEPGEQRELS